MHDSKTDITTKYYYDNLGRNTGVYESNENVSHSMRYSYDALGRVSKVVEVCDDSAYVTKYTYNGNSQVSKLDAGASKETYVYDSANQLIRENNQAAGKTWVWTYDAAGNVRTEKEYAYTTGTPGTVVASKTYSYQTGTNVWGDLLINNNGKSITYDGAGNPLSDGTWNYTWQEGRKLEKMTSGSTAWTFTYDANGVRTSRTNGSTSYNYIYHGEQLTHMTYGNVDMHFYYDASGRPLSFTYNGTTYYYVLNLQGDVVAILDSTGEQVVGYVYDAWGKLIKTTGTASSSLGLYNPLRYRGYVYDRETGLYYLQSRYYNPEIGRFINADRYISTGVGILGYNMFAYCNNNPIRFVDYSGECVEAFLDDADDALGFLELLGVGDCGGGTYHYAVDFAHAERSSVWGYPLLNGGWSSYSYWSPMYGGGGTSVGAATKGGSASKTYQTYTKTNLVTGEVYSGRTSGMGTPAGNVRKRDVNHHMNAKGFGPAVLDRTSYNYQAIRGREQMLIDYYGGAKSMGGISGNAINGIGLNNKNRGIYIEAARGEFGYLE